MKLLPFVPGHFTLAEVGVLAVWLVTGGLLGRRVLAGRTAEATEKPQ